MLPIHWLAASLASAALATAAAPAAWRGPIWIGLGFLAFAIGCYAAFSQTSKLLGPCLTHGNRTKNLVALTFDDGPGLPGTPAVLDFLAARGVVANFFLIGKNAVTHPTLLQRIVEEGHLIANHSFSHQPWLTLAPTRVLTADLRRCQEALRGEDAPPQFFRPPYGIRTHASAAAAAKNGLTVVGWDCGGFDTTGRSLAKLTTRLRRQLQPGSIILLHDHVPDPERTLALLAALLDELDRRGLQAVRLDELLAADEP